MGGRVSMAAGRGRTWMRLEETRSGHGSSGSSRTASTGLRAQKLQAVSRGLERRVAAVRRTPGRRMGGRTGLEGRNGGRRRLRGGLLGS